MTAPQEIAPWFQRRFVFDSDPALSPNLIARLAGVPARLAEVLEPLSRDQQVERVAGKWSVLEHVGHLADLESLFSGRVDEFLAGAEVLQAADLANAKTEAANHNARPTRDVLAEQRATREAFVAKLDALAAEDFARESRHPRLDQPMRLFDHLVFVAEHDDHHIAVIRRLVAMHRSR